MSDEITPNHAVIDRIVDEITAVLLVGPDETELQLPVGSLPAAVEEGTWVVLDTGGTAVTAIDHELTAARRERAAERMERIRRNRSGGRFSR